MSGGEGRVLVPEAEIAPVLAAIVATVNETILPAFLTFNSDGGETLTLAAAARRLRGVEAASDGLAAGDLVGSALDGEDEEVVAALAALLHRFASGALGAVSVNEARGKVAPGRGLGRAALQDMLSAVPPAAPKAAAQAASLPERFVTECGAALIASLLVAPDGAETALGDEEDLIEVLGAMTEVEVDGDGPDLNIWLRQTGPDDGRAFAVARWPGAGLASVAFPAGEVGALARAFNAILPE